MTNFSYSLEDAYVDYIQNNITSSNTYPILRGFATSSFDLPIVSCFCSSFAESDGMEYTGVMEATFHVVVQTNFLMDGASDSHGLVVGEIDRLTRASYNVLNWINNPSSSIQIVAPMFKGVSNVIKEDAWETQYHFQITAQQTINPLIQSTLNYI